MRSKALYVDVSPNQQDGWPLRPPYALRHRLSKQAFVEGNGETSV